MSPQLHDNSHQVIRGGGVEAPSPFPFEPNFIDWRTSRGRADRRAEADDETLEICAHCETEIDVAQPMHRPNCAGIGAPRASRAEAVSGPAITTAEKVKHRHNSGDACPVAGCRWNADGDGIAMELGHALDGDLDVSLEEVPEEPTGSAGVSSSDGDSTDERAADPLEQEGPRSPTAPGGGSVDQGLGMAARTPGPTLEAVAAVGDFTGSGTAGSPSSEPERAAATSPTTKSAKNPWARGEIIAAIQRWNAEHGQPPGAREWAKAQTGCPNTSTVVRYFGKWSDAIEAAGFTRPVQGQHYAPTGSQAATGTTDRAGALADELAAAGADVQAAGLRYNKAVADYVAHTVLEHLRAEAA